ncbi:hypothetical protein [Stratiformator vulcanicus]|uniref:Uncharacterized protein n=1 Tax=Stratiformator vulcanicus TaxID=2527980 RepID=A0A517R694_9PLAN|nr:hypothetical protein [Stratiformator vulcanicus]QDT39408.1 hypothetical protein Pan189_38150 [Stratiformator vulcanicus]
MNDLKLLKAAINRPNMYTLHGSYAEIVAFLEGYYSGAALAIPDNPSSQAWSEFESFLSRELKVPSAEVFRHIEEKHSTDAIQTLSDFAERFLASDTVDLSYTEA